MEKGKCSGVREPKDLHLVSLRELGDKGLIEFYLKNTGKYFSQLSSIAMSPDLYLLIRTLMLYCESAEEGQK